jgi:hypothetical protein
MADAPGFNQFAPGFDFLKGLAQNAGAAMPNIGNWVAPTLDPKELEKCIEELRTVQFWLDQNSRLLATTIQALEVQRMTLSTLKTMNVQMGDLRDSLNIRMPGTVPEADDKKKAGAAAPAAKAKAGDAPLVDPMQWWGALTQQFTQLATNALKDQAAAAPQTAASPPARAGRHGGDKDDAAKPATKRSAAPARKRAAAKRPR